MGMFKCIECKKYGLTTISELCGDCSNKSINETREKYINECLNTQQKINNIKNIIAESNNEEQKKIIEWLMLCCINNGILNVTNLDELINIFGK